MRQVKKKKPLTFMGILSFLLEVIVIGLIGYYVYYIWKSS